MQTRNPSVLSCGLWTAPPAMQRSVHFTMHQLLLTYLKINYWLLWICILWCVIYLQIGENCTYVATPNSRISLYYIVGSEAFKKEFYTNRPFLYSQKCRPKLTRISFNHCSTFPHKRLVRCAPVQKTEVTKMNGKAQSFSQSNASVCHTVVEITERFTHHVGFSFEWILFYEGFLKTYVLS